MRPDGYVAEVECTLSPGNRKIYYFTSHNTQPGGVCWGPSLGFDHTGVWRGNAGIILWASEAEARRRFRAYAKAHSGSWRFLRAIPVAYGDRGFVVIKENRHV